MTVGTLSLNRVQAPVQRIRRARRVVCPGVSSPQGVTVTLPPHPTPPNPSPCANSSRNTKICGNNTRAACTRPSLAHDLMTHILSLKNGLSRGWCSVP